MEGHIINRQFYIVFTALSCGILSILTGGFGNVLLDKCCHFVIFFGVLFINFYLININKSKYLIKILSLTIFVFIYSSIINPFLVLFGLLIAFMFFVFPNPSCKSSPNIFQDSPLSYGFKNIPPWKIIMIFLYTVPLYFVWVVLWKRQLML